MAGVIVISVGLGVFFLLQGAWPVFGFFGLDIAPLYLAFRLSYRSGRLRETIRVTADEVVVRRIAPNGRTTEWHPIYRSAMIVQGVRSENGAPTGRGMSNTFGSSLMPLTPTF